MNSPSANSAGGDGCARAGLIVKLRPTADPRWLAAALRETRPRESVRCWPDWGSKAEALASGAELLRFDQLMGW